MLSAAIDVGSNTLRLLIGEIHEGLLSRVYAGRVITRLAEGMGSTGALKGENMKKSITVLGDFSRSIAEYGATRVKAVGTSALREAWNAEEFVGRAYAETGILIEVISGTREAELTAKGILLGCKETTGTLLIIDIGGGSTEWIIRNAAQKPSLYGSVPIGVVNLLERFVRNDPPSSLDISSLVSGIEADLMEMKRAAGPLRPLTTLIGSGGTITTLAAIDLGLKEYLPERVHMHNISLERLYQLRDLLVALPLSRRKDLNGLEQGRADLIIPGILLTIKLMEIFDFRAITVSDYGLLEGIIKEMSDENSL